MRNVFDDNWTIKKILFQESHLSNLTLLKENIPDEIGDSIFGDDAMSKIDNDDVFFSIVDENEQNEESNRMSLHELD